MRKPKKKVEEKPKRWSMLPEDKRLMPLTNKTAKNQYKIWMATVDFFGDVPRAAVLRDLLVLRLLIPRLWEMMDLLVANADKKLVRLMKKNGMKEIRASWERYLKRINDEPIT